MHDLAKKISRPQPHYTQETPTNHQLNKPRSTFLHPLAARRRLWQRRHIAL